jgi:hypothetical protein
MRTEEQSKFDFKEMACYDGHITISAFDCVCGYKYTYYGILSRSERISFPRATNNYLRYIPLKDVECQTCKDLMYEKFLLEESDK